MTRPFFLVTCTLLFMGCGATVPSRAVTQGDLAGELVTGRGDTPPDGPDGACWARDLTPAVIETVTEQKMVAPATLGPNGAVLAPATFRSVTQQKIVQDRRDVWFRTPCPADITVAFTASLQRALKARGLYAAPVTGEMDAETRLAVRRFQEPRGLDSAVISLAAARELGIAATAISDL